jgi:hypothetical protein
MIQLDIEAGAQLHSIAFREQVDWRDILDANPTIDPLQSVQPGTRLNIPESRDLELPQTRVFGALIDARNKFSRLELGSFASENELISETPNFQPSNAQIEAIAGIGKVESLSNAVIKRRSTRQETVVNWTNIE